MFAKTVCKPGLHMCVVPQGLLVTIQYSARGTVEKIYTGYNDDMVECDAATTAAIKQIPSVLAKIGISGGTTWVEGVIRSSTLYYPAEGVLPMCLSSTILSDITSSNVGHTFYAGNVRSNGASFTSFLGKHNWLKMSGFHLLPTMLAFAGMTDAGFDEALASCYSDFPMIAGFMIFDQI